MIRALKIALLALAFAIAAPSLRVADYTVTFGHSAAQAQVEVDLQWHKGFQFLDSNGDPLSAGKVFVQDAGTSAHRTTYADEDGTVENTFTSDEIILDAAGRFTESVYITVGSWKFTVKDSDDATVYSEDNIEGAHATSTFLTGSASWTLPVLSKTANYTVVADDLGKCINADPTGGAFTVTLISAATAGDGKTLCVRHVGTANEVTIATVSSQTIDGHDTFVLSDQYDSALLVSDGADWSIAANATPPGAIQFIVADTLTAPPVSPTAGAWYIIDGTPTGDWSTFADEDIVRAAGDGGWHKFTPPTDSGWIAYLQDENLLMQFRDSAWVDLDNITAPTASDLGEWFGVYDETDGTNSVFTTSVNDYTKIVLDNELVDTISGGVTLSAGVASLPAGTYLVIGHACVDDATTGKTKLAIRDSGLTEIAFSGQVDIGAGEHECFTAIGQAEFASADSVRLDLHTELSAGTTALGNASPDTGAAETYAWLRIIDMSSLQGPTGATGAQGAQGAAGLSGFSYNFDSATTMADPGAGDIRFDNATLASVTAIAINAGTSDSGNPDISDFIATWDDSTSTSKGKIQISKASATENIVIFDVTAVTDNTDWLQITVSYIQSSGSFSDANAIKIDFHPNGDKGDTGDTGATGATGSDGTDGTDAGHVLTFSADTNTTTDPGTGNFELNNGTVSSVTEIAVDDQSATTGNPDISGFVATWDDSTSTTKGFLLIKDVDTPGTFAVFKITSITDATTHHRVGVTYVDHSGTFAGDASLQFSTSGDAGAAANSFETMNASSGTDPVADSGTDTLIMTGTAPVVVTGDSAADSLTYSLSGTTAQFNTSLSDGSFATLAGSETLTNKTITAATIATSLDMNGTEFILDADGDTSITADTDDQIDFRVGAADEARLTASALLPATSNGSALGTSANMWADLFLASGGVINFNNGDVTITHSANTVTIGGASTGLNLSAGTVQEGGTDISPIGEHTIWIPGGAMIATTTAGATAETREIAADQPMLNLMSFPTSSNTNAQFNFTFPKGSNESAAVTYQVYWTADAGTATQTVNFDLSCLARGNSDPLASAFGTAQGSDDALIATNDVHISPESSAITVGGTPAEGDTVFCQLERDTADTLSDDAQVIGVLFIFTTNAATDD